MRVEGLGYLDVNLEASPIDPRKALRGRVGAYELERSRGIRDDMQAERTERGRGGESWKRQRGKDVGEGGRKI